MAKGVFWQALKDSINNGWNRIKNFVGSFTNKLSGASLTGAEKEANEFSAQQAQLNRDWETEMSNTAFQRQVADMQAAGVNPALMYGSGASGASVPSGSAPSSVSPSSGMSFSDLVQLMMIPEQKALLQAQARNTDTDTDKKAAEIDYQKLINKYYPEVTQTSIDKVLSDIGINNERISQIKTEVDTLKLDQDLKRIDMVIKQAEADQSSAYFKARREFEEANTDKVKAEKAEILAREAIEVIEKNYMQKYNFKMSSSSILAIAAALDELLPGFWNSSTSKLPFDTEAIKESLKRSLTKVGDFFADGIGR